jgi:hypothetical protein
MSLLANMGAVLAEVFHPSSSPARVLGLTDTNGQPTTTPQTTPAPQVGTNFRMIFLSVFALTVLAMIGNLYIAMNYEHPNPGLQQLLDGLNSLWKACSGGLLGLLGGKSS